MAASEGAQVAVFAEEASPVAVGSVAEASPAVDSAVVVLPVADSAVVSTEDFMDSMDSVQASAIILPLAADLADSGLASAGAGLRGVGPRGVGLRGLLITATIPMDTDTIIPILTTTTDMDMARLLTGARLRL